MPRRTTPRISNARIRTGKLRRNRTNPFPGIPYRLTGTTTTRTNVPIPRYPVSQNPKLAAEIEKYWKNFVSPARLGVKTQNPLVHSRYSLMRKPGR